MDMDPNEVFAACRRGDLSSLQLVIAKDSTLLRRKDSSYFDETPYIVPAGMFIVSVPDYYL